MTLNDLLDDYILARWCYAIGESGMSDPEYNELHAHLLKEIPDNEYVKRPWSEDPCPIKLLQRLNRMDLYRDISVQFGSESMPSLRSDAEVAERFRGLHMPTRLSYKVDGWNNQINYYNGVPISANTRGRATNAIDSATLLAVAPQKIPMLGKVKVIVEASIPNAKWQQFKQEYGGSDQRASMSTVLARDLSDYVSLKAFNVVSEDNELPEDKYKLLTSWGFETPKSIMVRDYNTLLAGIAMMGKMKDKCDVLTDGLVVENKDIQIALRVGAWQESNLWTYITGYIENVTPFGVAMTLSVAPTSVDGKTVSVLNITNLSQIAKNNLMIGSPVAFVIRSGANPQINLTATRALQEEWAGRYEDYKNFIEASR